MIFIYMLWLDIIYRMIKTISYLHKKLRLNYKFIKIIAITLIKLPISIKFLIFLNQYL